MNLHRSLSFSENLCDKRRSVVFAVVLLALVTYFNSSLILSGILECRLSPPWGPRASKRVLSRPAPLPHQYGLNDDGIDGQGSLLPLKQNEPSKQNNITILAILARYHENTSWIEDTDAGVLLRNSNESLILPIQIYQSSDVDVAQGGYPAFPGFNLSTLMGQQNSSKLSTPPLLHAIPTWPAWAWPWVVAKNATLSKQIFPGTVQEAEYRVRKQIGLPDGGLPSEKEWREYENLDGWSAFSSSSSTEKETGFSNSTELEEAIIRAKNMFEATPHHNLSTTVLLPNISALVPLKIVPNRGAEAMAYLSAIIDHYDNLPDIMIFMHAHRFAWHTPLGQDWVLRRLATHPPSDPNLTSTNGYHALGCLERWGNDISVIFPSVIDANYFNKNGMERWREVVAGRFAQAWHEHLGGANGNLPLPDYIRVPTAASFAASKSAILRRPKSYYEGIREWMMKTTIENKYLGILLEFHTGIMMANKTHISVSREQCLCELYSICTSRSEV